MRMLLYHVSLSPITEFIPRVPMSRASGEDMHYKRICCCPTIKDCIDAMPGGASTLLCLQKIGIKAILYVYQFQVRANDPVVLSPEKVVKLVPDALINKEYWLFDSPKTTRKLYYTVDLIGTSPCKDKNGEFIYPVQDLRIRRLQSEPEYTNTDRILESLRGKERKNKFSQLIEKYGISCILREFYRAIS